ncbi:hypothetical protein QZH41_012443 [Actinostola sp. cb2023]|nr:hypothetical protein QZH41_012443 [Actinostola sp. cb2023]
MIVGLTNCMISLLFATTFASASLDTEYTNSAYLDEAETFKLHWKIDDTKKQIWFGVQVKTLGWVGFGISAGTGNMVGSDVVIGWVKDNKGYLEDDDDTEPIFRLWLQQDRYADAKALPSVDKKQDYKLLEAYEKNGETVLKFTRKYDTCDERDRKIEVSNIMTQEERYDLYMHTTRMIQHLTPISPKHAVRGSRSLMLLNVLSKKPSLPADVKHFDLRVNASISNQDTTYYCKPFKMPEFASKKHIVKISPLISPGNEGLVHHILVYECRDDLPPSNLTHEGNCLSPNMPDSLVKCSGRSTMVAWALGGSVEHTYGRRILTILRSRGYNLGERVVRPQSLAKQLHFIRHKGDGTRLFIFLTTLAMPWGVALVQNLFFLKFTMTTRIENQGLQNSTLPEGGIKVFASVLHTHLLGIAIWTKHVRNGTELPEIARDNHYDFNYQEYHFLKKEIHILPGGIKTRDEMCMNFMYYYPKVQLTKCLSINKGMENFFVRHFMKNKTVVGFPPAKWTNELIVDLRKSYDEMKYVKVRCAKQNAEDLAPIHGTFVRKAVITKPLPMVVRSCPKPKGPEGYTNKV